MAADSGFWPPGGARRVHQGPHVLGCHLDPWAVRRRTFDQRLVGRTAMRLRTVAEMHETFTWDVELIADRRHAPDQVVLHHECASVTVLGYILDFGSDEAEVDRHRDQPGTGKCDIELHPLKAVVS